MILVQHGARGIRVGNIVVDMEFSCCGVLVSQCLPHLDTQFIVDNENSRFYVEEEAYAPDHHFIETVHGGNCIECGVSEYATQKMEELGFQNVQVVAKVKRSHPPLISELEIAAKITIHIPSAFICTHIWSDSCMSQDIVWDADVSMSEYSEFLKTLGAGQYCVCHPQFTFLETV